jgi:nucleoside-diphosphate-sugar epimerase
VQALGARGFDSIFHLAATLTLEAERDPDGAFAVNVEATRELIAAHRATVPRIVFASSIAVFGGALPESVDDEVRPMPMTTYGSHKAIAELLLADATRHGWVDGRALRLPIVLIRPGSPNPAVSDRVAAIVREPLAGRDVVCPLAPETQIPVASARAVARALVRLHDLPASSLPSGRAMNLPALTVSIAEMVRALERQRRPGRAIGSVTFSPDPILQPIVDGWPKRFVSADASRLGLGPDPDLDEIYAGYLAELDCQHGRS